MNKLKNFLKRKKGKSMGGGNRVIELGLGKALPSAGFCQCAKPRKSDGRGQGLGGSCIRSLPAPDLWPPPGQM